jgi:hypothetical protein
VKRRVAIVNETKIPTAKIRDIVNFVAPSGKWSAELRVANGTTAHGQAFSRRATIWIPTRKHWYWSRRPSGRYPIRFRQGGGYMGGVIYSEEECVVFLAAHELRHCQKRQMKVRTLRPWNGRRTGHAGNEGDCDMFAIRALRAWRRRGRPEPDVRLPTHRQPVKTTPAPTSTPQSASLQKALDAARAGQARALARMKRGLANARRADTAFRRYRRTAERIERRLTGASTPVPTA